jgi:hypothetical protein
LDTRPQQVGKAAISGWREVLIPGLDDKSINLSIWPFSGDFEELINNSEIVVVETYPAEYYQHFNLPISKKKGSGKSSKTARALCAPILRKWAYESHVDLDKELEIQIDKGFTSSAFKDDGFDACIGVFGMLNLIKHNRTIQAPHLISIQKTEGWIFGQSFT